MISSNDLRPGTTVELDNDAWTVVEFQHVKPGKGAAFVRTKLKSVKSGSVVEKTFRAGEKMPKANLEKKEMQFTYAADDDYFLLDLETFDTVPVPASKLGDATKWIKEDMKVELLYFHGNIVGVSIPNFVELRITDTPPGVKGDTASGGGKPATVETGAVVQVPFFVNVDDVIRIDTRTGEYLDRA